ncbi:MAG: T9SS type A sorting domain-containing protein [bacterium]
MFRKRGVLTRCAIGVLWGAILLAQNYRIKWSAVSIGGATMSSNNYRLPGSISQPGVGRSQSNNYHCYWGLWVPTTEAWGWMEMSPIPGVVKTGAWLVTNTYDGLIYASQGSKTGYFCRYDPVADTWAVLNVWPGILPSKGSAGCYGDRCIYATKGHNTFEFWAYSFDSLQWIRLPDVLAGNNGNKVRGGTDLVYVVENDTGYVYLLKGYKTDFFRFNTIKRNWEMLPDAPTPYKVNWREGSWLVYDGNNTIYAHNSRYHTLWTFDLITHQWAETSLQGIPKYSTICRKRRKCKDGGSGIYYNGYIYALKGGNTTEFWRYSIASDTWLELDTIPQVGFSGRKKRVKGGGDITIGHDNTFFVLKGNKTQEFWRYIEVPVLAAPAKELSGATGANGSCERFGFNITPNPLTKGNGILNYNLPRASEAQVTINDIAGRTVTRLRFVANSKGRYPLDLRRLPNGVYLVRFATEDFTATGKVVVQ